MKWLLAKVQEINQSLGYSKLDLYRSFHHDVTDQEAMHTIGLQIMKGQPSRWCPKKILWGIELFSHFNYRSQYWDNSITLASVIPKQKTHLCMTCNFFFLGRDEHLLTWNLEPPAQKAMHQPTVKILPSTAITIFFLKLTLKLVVLTYKSDIKVRVGGGGGGWKGLFFTCLHFFPSKSRQDF